MADLGEEKELRILMLEDVPSDAELEESVLREAGLVFTLLRVDTREAFEQASEAENQNRLAFIDDKRFARLAEQWPKKIVEDRQHHSLARLQWLWECGDKRSLCHRLRRGRRAGNDRRLSR